MTIIVEATAPHNNHRFYALTEVAQRLKADVSELIWLAQAQTFDLHNIEGVWHIRDEDFALFLRAFQTSREIPDRYHAVPEWLT